MLKPFRKIGKALILFYIINAMTSCTDDPELRMLKQIKTDHGYFSFWDYNKGQINEMRYTSLDSTLDMYIYDNNNDKRFIETEENQFDPDSRDIANIVNLQNNILIGDFYPGQFNLSIDSIYVLGQNEILNYKQKKEDEKKQQLIDVKIEEIKNN